MNTVEQLLSRPMPQISDQGFSDKVIADIAKFNRQRIGIFTILYALIGISLVAFFPIKQWLIKLTSFIFNHNISITTVTNNSLQLSAQLSQPIVFLAMIMVVIFIFTRAEN